MSGNDTNNTHVEQSPPSSLWKRHPCIVGMLAAMMLMMSYYMAHMTAYVGSMTNNVDHMSLLC